MDVGEEMKVLCVCEKGNMRSVACAYLLKKKYKVDVLACGVRTNSPDTLRMLGDWADIIFIMSEPLLKYMPNGIISEKMHILHLGTDKWFKGYPEDLMAKCDELLQPFLPSITMRP